MDVVDSTVSALFLKSSVNFNVWLVE